MDFLYPKIDKPTHILNKGSNNTTEYPFKDSYKNSKELVIENDASVAVIRDNIGYSCNWSQVIAFEGNNKDKTFYVLSKDLQNITTKISYKPVCTSENSIDINIPEIDPNSKEIFVPYIDKRNGLYSVRIQSDYEKVLDSLVFENLLHDIFYEGVSILLASRGFRSDNAYVDSLVDKYVKFAFINNDLDLTVNRECEPLTFTVSIPLNFFNEKEMPLEQAVTGVATKILNLDSRTFRQNISKLLSIFTSRADDVQKLLYPNNIIENFIIDFELSAIRTFSTEFNEFVSLQNFSINDMSVINDYELGFDNDLNIVFFKLKNIAEQKTLNQPQLSLFRLKPNLYSKRIFNYLLNLDEMVREAASFDIKTFIFKYVKYPDPKFASDTIYINGKRLPEEKANQFRKDLAKSTEECINLSDLTSITKSISDLASYTDPLYHIFIKKDVDNIKDYNTYKSFIDQGKSSEEALKNLKKSLETSASKPSTVIKAEQVAKDQLLIKSKQQIDDAKKAKEEASSNLDKSKKALESAYENFNYEDKEGDQFKILEEENNKNLKALEDAKKTLENLEEQKDLVEKTPAEQLAKDGKLTDLMGPTDEQLANLKSSLSKISIAEELKELYSSTGPVNIAYSNSTGEIRYNDSNDINISTLLYILQRINLQEAIFKKVLCVLKGTDPSSPIIAEILSQIPTEIINYFNYLNTVKTLTGTAYIDALQKGTAPDVKIYCSQNNSVVYFVKGLKRLLSSIDKIADIAWNIIPNIGTKLTTTGNPYDAFVKNLTQNIARILASLLLDFIRESLLTSCEDPVADLNNNNFSDPFSTHFPVGGFGGSNQNNNNQNIVKNNRADILDKNFGDVQLQFGFDREYLVDLIGRLINDINCILTPIESVQLLQGTPTETVIVLIKNIIRAKYSEAPNDLTFLLSDENKLKQFFKELGFTVDPGYISKVEEVTKNYLEPSSICDDQTLRARKDLEEKKLPKDLGTLQRRQEKRIKTAKKLFDKIKNGETSVEISPLCPDFTDDEVEAAKDTITDNYLNFVRSTFADTLMDFTQESKQLPDNYIDKRLLFRKDSNGTLFDSVEYYLYNAELGANLLYEKPKTINFVTDSAEYESIFKPTTLKNDFGELSKTLVSRTFSDDTKIFCPEENFKINSEFDSFLKNNLILIEFPTTRDYQFDDRGDGSGDLSEYVDPEQDKYNEVDGKYIRSKKYIFTISAHYDPLGADEVSMKIIFNDTDNNQLRILNSQDFEGDISEGFNSNDLRIALDEVLDNLPDDQIFYIENQLGIGEYTKNSAIVDLVNKKTAEGLAVALSDSDDIYVLSKPVFDRISNPAVKQLIQSVYESKFKQEIDKIENFDQQKRLLEEYTRVGLFQDRTNVDIKNQTFRKTISVTSGVPNPQTGLPDLTRKEFCSWKSYEIFDKNIDLLKDVPFGSTGFETIASDAQTYAINGQYFKFLSPEQTDYVDFGAKLKTGKWEFFDTTNIKDQIADKDFDIQYNPKIDNYKILYALYTLLDYPVDVRFRKCKILPHYLNLDYILQNAKSVKKADLCDIKNYNPNDIIKICLVELTFRVYITDFLVKSIPYLTTMNIDNLKNMYTSQVFVDILKEFFKRELQVFNPNTSIEDPNETEYYKYFYKITKEVYNKYKTTTDNNNQPLLKEKFISKYSADEEFDYFIKKEIYRFIKYSLDKNIFAPSANDYKQYAETKYTNITPSEKANILFKKLWIFEYESQIGYHIMANTIDNRKRSIFYSAKSDLANAFFSNIASITTVEQKDTNIAEESNKSQEDIIKFINDSLLYNPNPASMVLLKPEYGKYVKKYLSYLLQTSRTTLAVLAEATDPNVSIARKINYISTTLATTTFSFLDEKTRLSAILADPTLTAKRICDGRSPAPDLSVSLSLMGFGIFPLLAGWAHLTADSIQEGIYYATAKQERDQLLAESANKQDPCKITSEDRNKVIDDISCTPDSQKKLREQIKALEET